MELIGTILIAPAVFLLFNVLFALLYILSKSAGIGFYRWITHDGLLDILSFPIMGLTQWAASSLYERHNWFVARVLLILYTILIFILAIVSFIVFGYIEDIR